MEDEEVKIQKFKPSRYFLDTITIVWSPKALIQTFHYFKWIGNIKLSIICICPLDITDKIIIKTPPGPKA